MAPDTNTENRLVSVLGGGQLGRMMAQAGSPLGFRFAFLDPAEDACAGELGEHKVAAFDDEMSAKELAADSRVVTFDFENVPVTTARAVESECAFYPAPDALGAAQDRLSEKQLMTELGIAVPAFHPVETRIDLLEGLDNIGYPAVLKTRRMGYDGKGQVVLRGQEDLERAWQKLGGQPLILEAFVPFEFECSLIAARSANAKQVYWPLTRNVHDQGILALSLPGGVSDDLQQRAETIMSRLLTHFDYVGVLTIEFFVMNDELLVNEIAPRVHNSGHWTIDGAVCSQFENHIRAITGLPLGSPSMTGHSLMFNWIGEFPSREKCLAVPGLHWHDYAKQPRAGRKIGHATLVADDAESLKSAGVKVADICGGRFPALLATIYS